MTENGPNRRNSEDWLSLLRESDPTSDSKRIEEVLDMLEPEAMLPEECIDVSQSLEDYVALAEEGPRKMPSIHEHLDHCERCKNEVLVLERVRADIAEWEKLAAALCKPPPRLVLIKGEWRWPEAAGQKATAVTPEDFTFGRQVANWQLGPPQVHAVGFNAIGLEHQGRIPQVALSISLDEIRSTLVLKVTPEFLPTVHAETWLLSLQLEPDAAIEPCTTTPRIRVGLGDQERAERGWRTLVPDKMVEFKVSAPGLCNYWLHLEWSDARGERIQKKLEIPLGSE